MAANILVVAGKAAEHAKRPGIGVDDACADAAVLGQAEFRRCLRCQRADIDANRACLFGQIAMVKKIVEADEFEEVALPCDVLVRQISPLRCQRALRAGQRARCLPGQEIGQVEQIAGFIPCLR
ncbi:hypothetical protein X738_05815 [Mesorhizobium sp. LNHC209A00]|nr:hypothetical protein X738_05815 [Mesorhizobium sp. LNHC209A00]